MAGLLVSTSRRAVVTGSRRGSPRQRDARRSYTSEVARNFRWRRLTPSRAAGGSCSPRRPRSAGPSSSSCGSRSRSLRRPTSSTTRPMRNQSRSSVSTPTARRVRCTGRCDHTGRRHDRPPRRSHLRQARRCARRCANAARALRPDAHGALGGVPARRRLRAGRARCDERHVSRARRSDIDAYVASGEWEGRAGAYAIQGLGGRLVARIDGDYLNVVGLPGALLVDLLERHAPELLLAPTSRRTGPPTGSASHCSKRPGANRGTSPGRDRSSPLPSAARTSRSRDAARARSDVRPLRPAHGSAALGARHVRGRWKLERHDALSVQPRQKAPPG